jgi:hypothetical protein
MPQKPRTIETDNRRNARNLITLVETNETPLWREARPERIDQAGHADADDRAGFARGGGPPDGMAR